MLRGVRACPGTPRARPRTCSRRGRGYARQHDQLPPAQGRAARGRPRHPLPASDQGPAQGDAPRRRQAGHPVRRRGGRRGRPHRPAHDHRPGQDRLGGPLRPVAVPGAATRGEGRLPSRRVGAGVCRPRTGALRAPGRGPGPGPCGAAGGRACGRRTVRGAARRRPGGRVHPGPAADGAGAGALRRVGAAADGGHTGADLQLRLRRRRADRRARRGAGDRPDREAAARRGTQHLCGDRPVRARSGRIRCSGVDRTRPRRRDPADRRTEHADRPGPARWRDACGGVHRPAL